MTDGQLYIPPNDGSETTAAFNAIDSAGNTEVTVAEVQMPMDTVVVNDDATIYSIAANVITIAETGTYHVVRTTAVGGVDGGGVFGVEDWIKKNSVDVNDTSIYIHGAGGEGTTVTAVTTTYTVLATDEMVLCDATSAAFTVTLPAAADGNQRVYIKKVDSSANAVTIDGDGAETIDGSTTKVLSSQYDSVTLISDGTEWHIA